MIHGIIREVSLVVAGANPKAFIDEVVAHGEEVSDAAVMYFGEELSLEHGELPDSEEEKQEETVSEQEDTSASIEHADSDTEGSSENSSTNSDDEETIADVFNSLTEKQKTAVYAMIGQALESAESSEDDEETGDNDNNVQHNEGGNDNMKVNVFDQNKETQQGEHPEP